MSASAISIIHIVSGSACVAGGSLALMAPKGGRLHKAGGRAFFYAMLVTALSGSVLGVLEPERLIITAFAGLLAAYLVLTGWRTARWGETQFARFEQVSLAGILLVTASLAGLGSVALDQAGGRYLGFAAEDYFMLATMSGFGALFDVSLLVRGPISDRQRVARHLWRMGLAYFIAIGSLFTGPGARVFPEALRESGLLSAPEGITALLIVFYVLRTLFNRPRRASRS